MQEAPHGKECHRRAQSKRTRVNTADKPGRQRDPVSWRAALGRAGKQTAVTLITGTLRLSEVESVLDLRVK